MDTEKTVGYSLANVGTVELEKTKERALITNIIVCKDKIIIIDCIGWKIRLYRPNGRFVTMSGKLESRPRAFCLIDAMNICLIHGDGLINVMSIDSTDMSPVFQTTRSLRLQGAMDNYDNVVRFNDNLAVSGVKEGSMYWCVVSIHDGHVAKIHQICEGDGGICVTTKDNLIYISCRAGDKFADNTGVYGFDILNPSECKYTYKHQYLQRPSSIVINEDGYIFVCNYRVPNESIHQLTASCQLVAIFKEEIPSGSHALYWDNGRLYLSCYESRNITIFEPVYEGIENDAEEVMKQENVDTGQSNINTELHPSVPAPEDTEDEKQGVINARERNPELHDKNDDIVREKKQLNIIDKVMSFEENVVKPIQQIDEESLKQVVSQKDTEDRDLFIVFQREIGIPLHFSNDPQTLIDAQTSLKDTEMFLQENRPDIIDKWFEYKHHGKLVRELIDVIYAQERFPEVHVKIGDFLAQMEQLNVIFNARSFDENGMKEENYFLTPCMLDQECPREIISPRQDPRMVRTPVLLFVLTGKVMQPRIFNELLAAFGRQWPVAKKMETSENIMFCNCAVYDLGVFHRLILHYRNHVICARVTRMLSVEAETPDAKLCTIIRRFITVNLRNIISREGHTLKYELCVQCEESEDVSENSMFHFLPPFHMWFLREDPDLPITLEHMNHARLNIALVTVCGKAMRDVLLEKFDQQYQDIYQAILAKKCKLMPARGTSVLNQHQIQLVYPDHPNGQQTGTVDQFDLSLLYTLIRNVSTVPEPTTFWGNDPQEQPRDSSLGASVERIRSYRNLISGHSPDAKMEQEEFENYWFQFDAVNREIENALGRQVYCSELARHRRHVISVYEA